MSDLRVTEVRTSFGQTRALGGVPLEPSEGEMLALLGPNGAGKTARAITVRVRLDGYTGAFWREAPLAALWPQLAVLTASTVAFPALARLLARRWETV